jgi:hypothetical protein
MSSLAYPPAVDPHVQAALEAELTTVLNTPELRPLVQHPPQALLPRFAQHYERLRALPRRPGGRCSGNGNAPGRHRSPHGPSAGLALAATIAVAAGTPPAISRDRRCALIEAIVNANADAATHADCVAGREPTPLCCRRGACGR